MPNSWTRIALVPVLFSTGCAAMMKESPGSNWRVSEAPSCSEGRGGVFLDGLLATGWSITGIAALSEEESGIGVALLAVAGLRLGDCFTDWTYLAVAPDLTWFAYPALGMASPANLAAGIFLILAFRKHSAPSTFP